MSEELKPCPFCGGAALLEVHEPHTHVIATFMPDHPGSATAECSQCSAAMIDDTAEKVAAAWNLRQQVPDGYAVVPVGAIGKFTAAGRSINPIAVSTLVREGLAIMDAMKPEDVK